MTMRIHMYVDLAARTKELLKATSVSVTNTDEGQTE